jgi:hypothetical protein
VNQSRLLDSACALAAIHVGRNTDGFREVIEPEREVEQREPGLEEDPAASLCTTMAPSLGAATQLVGSRAHAKEPSELPTAKEGIQRLHVAPEAMIVCDSDLPVRTGRRGEDALDTARSERERSLAHHVHLCRERAEHVRLMQVVGRRDDHGVEVVGLEQVLDVREGVGDPESLGEGARLGSIVVAQRNHLGAAHLRKHGQVCELCDRSRADHADPDPVAHRGRFLRGAASNR